VATKPWPEHQDKYKQFTKPRKTDFTAYPLKGRVKKEG